MGLNAYDIDLVIEKPKLWWLVGQGDQFRYILKTECKVDGILMSSKTKKLAFVVLRLTNRPILKRRPCLTYMSR